MGIGSDEYYDFLKEKASEYRADMLKEETEHEQKMFMIQALILELKNAGFDFAQSNKLAFAYVTKYFPFAEETSVVNEL